VTEYFNEGLFWITVIMGMILLPYAKEDKGLLVLWLIVFIGQFFASYITYKDAQYNIELFTQGNSLICFSGGGYYTPSNKYYISQSEGWILKENYFMKDSLMLRVDGCEKMEGKE